MNDWHTATEPLIGNEAPPLPHLIGSSDAAAREKYKNLRGVCWAVLSSGLFLLYHGYYTTTRPVQKASRLQLGYTFVIASLIGISVTSLALRKEDAG